jgi:hypothetical protein
VDWAETKSGAEQILAFCNRLAMLTAALAPSEWPARHDRVDANALAFLDRVAGKRIRKCVMGRRRIDGPLRRFVCKPIDSRPRNR